MLDGCSFTNNNYESSYFGGGFLSIESNRLDVKGTHFTNGVAKSGSAITLTPNLKGAIYIFDSCMFSNLIALTSGAGISLENSFDENQLIIMKCNFENMASTRGGVASIEYKASTSTLLTPSSSLEEKLRYYPRISIEDCTSS